MGNNDAARFTSSDCALVEQLRDVRLRENLSEAQSAEIAELRSRLLETAETVSSASVCSSARSGTGIATVRPTPS